LEERDLQAKDDLALSGRKKMTGAR